MKCAMLAALLTLALAGAVRAQATADEIQKSAMLEEARQHVAKAKMHYDLGEFKEAADEYIIVFRLRPIPAVLFNIAQAYRQGGMYDKARQFYKAYLRESPDAKNRATIQQSIREMDAIIARERQTKDAAPQGVKEPPEEVLPIKQPPAQAATPPPVPPPAKEPPPKVTPPAQVAAVPASPPALPPAGDATTKPSPPVAPVAPAASSGTAGTKVALAPVRTEPAPVALPRPGATFKTPLTREPPDRQRTWTWVAAGASAIALGGGAAFGYKTINGGAPSDARTANMLYGAGAVLAIAAAAFFVFEF